jgi:hypothetical protein
MNFFRFSFSRRTAFIIMGMILFFTFCFQQLWVKSRALELDQVTRSIAETQKKLEMDQLTYVQLMKRAPASVEVTSASQLLDEYLKFNGHFSSVVNGIVLSSKNTSFSLTKISSEKQVKATGYTQTLYSIEAEAPFIAIGKFLEKMEDSPLLTEVDSIEISRIGNEMKRCKAKIKLFSYVGAEP